jgi:Protein of unknown function (DUF3723)
MRKVDRPTVKALELTAPGACRADFEALYGKLRKGQIFGAFDEQGREDIWGRVLSASTDRLIPSLFGFFEDLNYLKNVADCMKRLFPLPPRGTVSSALEDAFKDANHRAGQCVMQESESTCVFRPGSLADRVDLGRRQMWIYAMRNYPQVPAEPKKKNLLAKPTNEKADEIILCEGAILASRLGYESEKIHSIAQRSPDREIARSALFKARKPDRYKYSEAAFEDYVEQIVNLFSAAQPVTEEEARAAVEIDCSDTSPKRSGIPHTQDHERDKLSLFVDKLHNTDEEQCDEISSFFIRRSVYFAFFGKPSRPNPRSPEVVSLLDSPILAHPGDDQVREEQERLARQEQERLEREEQQRLGRERERFAREEQQRLAREQERLAREEQERLAREEQERLAREEQERLAREEQERLAREEQERLAREQERLAREEQERLAREEQERLAREEQERLAREQERFAREEQQRLAREQERLAREEQERLAREEQERLAREQERLAREEQERLAREEQERLAREQERLAREEQGRLAGEQERLAREEQERLAREEQERLAREEQERLAREEQERLAKEEQERQEQAAREEQNKLAREEQERLAKEEQERLEREEQERLAKENQERLAREEQERLATEEQDRVAQEQERLIRAEQERLAREEQERVTREEQERLAENLATQWKDRPKQKKPHKNQPDKGSKVPRSQNGVRRGLRASALGKKRERPLTQFDLKKVINGESSEANYRFVPPSQVFDFSLGAAGDQVEVDNASHPPQPSLDSSAADNSTASGKLPQLTSDSREQNQAAERPAREEQEKLAMEEEDRLVREEQERVAHEEQEKAAREEETPATEGKERLVRNIAKQWEERLGQKMRKEKTQDQRKPKVVGKGVQRGIGAAKRNRPLTQFALGTLRDAKPQELIQGPSHQTAAENERRTMADQEEVGNPIHSAQPSADSPATDNSNSISASGKIPEHVTNSEEPIQAVEAQVSA